MTSHDISKNNRKKLRKMMKKDDNKDTIHDRIAQCVQQYGGGRNTAFADIIGTSEGNIRGYIKNVLPKADILENIVRKCDVSADWLLTGRGSMSVPEMTQEGTHPMLDKLLNQAEEIGRLKARVEELERRGGENAGDVRSSGSANAG